MFIVHRFVFIINLLAVVLLLCSYLVPYVSPETFSWLPFLGLAYPFLLLANLLFVIYWTIFFRLKLLWSLGTVVLGWSHVGKHVKLFGHKVIDKTGHISVLTFNAHFFGFGNHGVNTAPFFDMLHHEMPDIVCLQEVMWEEKDRRKNYLAKLKKATGYTNLFFNKAYTAMDTVHREYGMLVTSRYPIVGKGFTEFSHHSVNRCMWVDLLVNADTVRVFNVHLESIKIDEDEYAVMNMAESKDSTLKLAGSIAGKLQAAWQIRAAQAQKVQQMIKSSPHKVLVCGDFNDSPMSYASHTVGEGLLDAFVASGTGLSQTYSGQLPSFRIDYILGDPGLGFANYRVIPVEVSLFSDHKAITAWVALHPEDHN